MGNGYWRQRCENGDVWTRNGASEKYIVMLNLRDSFYKNGGYSSLGGPVADEENMGVAGGASVSSMAMCGARTARIIVS